MISKSRAVVMLSSFEGFGIPIVEAQRLGVPVIISDDKALFEVVSPYASVVRNFESAETIALAIVQAMSKSGQKPAPGRYDARTWNDVAFEIIRFFKQW